jgi:magnesium transporter
VIADCAHYRDGRRQDEGPMQLDDAETFCRGGDDGFVWLGLVEPDEAELEDVQERFGLHDLAVEDAQSFHLRPKLEQYDDGAVHFLVLRTARYVDERDDVEFGEVSVFMAERFFITVRRGDAGDLHDARLRVEARPDLLAEGPGAALWAVVDTVVDGYTPVIEGLEQDIDEVEATVFQGAAAATQRIYHLRREASEFWRAVHPLLAPLETIERGAFPFVDDALQPFFRDVNDHVKLADEEISAQRDLLATILQANMAVISVEQTAVSVRQNETSKQLTLIATIFLPLTFVTGFFGQNFGWMVDHVTAFWAFAVFGLGSMAVSGVALWLWFRRSGYAGRDEPPPSP